LLSARANIAICQSNPAVGCSEQCTGKLPCSRLGEDSSILNAKTVTVGYLIVKACWSAALIQWCEQLSTAPRLWSISPRFCDVAVAVAWLAVAP